MCGIFESRESSLVRSTLNLLSEVSTPAYPNYDSPLHVYELPTYLPPYLPTDRKKVL